MIGRIKKTAVMCLIFLALLWGGLRVLERIMIQKIPEIMGQVSTPAISVLMSDFEVGKCQWQACVTAKNVTIKLLNQQPISIGTVDLKINPILPLTVDIKTNEKSPIDLDISVSKYLWQVRKAKGMIGTFRFETGGFIDGKHNQGELYVQTQGLKTFLNHLVEIPAWMSFLIQDAQQQIILRPKNGMLNLYDIPLIPLINY